MSELYIGVISGTSLDAIDVACIEIKNGNPAFINASAYNIPDNIQQQCRTLIQTKQTGLAELIELDVQLGRMFAAAINDFIRKNRLDLNNIKAIGSHGQTIYHHPDSDTPGTLQLGDPNTIAEQTGITVVADLRRRDMAAGGQGAPLVPIFHNALTHKNRNIAIVNIGGIANVTVQDNAGHTLGYDTGPGNGLMDSYCRHHLGKAWDENGATAASGIVDKTLLQHFLSDSYFSQSVPKSTGSEYFNLAWLTRHLSDTDKAEDVLATLAELTAITIANAIHACSAKHLYVCGGGVHNHFLIERIQHHVLPIEVSSIQALGIHPDWIEACAFGWLAYLTMNQQPGNVCTVTGAAREVILGGIYPAST